VGRGGNSGRTGWVKFVGLLCVLPGITAILPSSTS